ncbi:MULTISPECIES: sigma factor-like helix-turn-helix DNA-binding protein [unclassified Paenibacillus]|uniref:sigma factor-like helix-turn-helix DNA-binding protein n=1 Tax=unclassified Paenibacillus TaxID=185978 RepID=UPI0024745506|nr:MULTISPECIES: sigma factor-like helix-turn-helix DNA-binding protein [unclassified Paenibacillus]
MKTITKATWIETLICQYATDVHSLERYRDTLDLKDPTAAEEAETVSGMLADMRYALTWMRRGRRPGSRRGAEITDVYRQRELLIKLAGAEMSNEEKLQMVDSLLLLSDRERTCFLLYVANGLTCQEISSNLGIASSTVYMYVTRAKNKLKFNIPKPL